MITKEKKTSRAINKGCAVSTSALGNETWLVAQDPSISTSQTPLESEIRSLNITKTDLIQLIYKSAEIMQIYKLIIYLVMGVCVSDDISEQYFTHRHLRHDIKPSNTIPQQSLMFQKLSI